MTLFDLTHPISSGMPVYPGDPAVHVESALHVATDGVNVAQLQLGSHTGTHLDAPAHVRSGGRTVDQLDLDLLHGEACVLPVRPDFIGHLAGQTVRVDDLVSIPADLPNIVCIATGWDQYFYAAQREQHPALDLDLVKTLWDRGARVLGVDTLSPDATAGNTGAFPVHEFWLGQDGIIVENLRSLTLLPQSVEMTILPLHLAGLDGSPVRAVAHLK